MGFYNSLHRLSDGARRGGMSRQTGFKVKEHQEIRHFHPQVVSVVDVPEEVCDLNPIETCRYATKLVRPQLIYLCSF